MPKVKLQRNCPPLSFKMNIICLKITSFWNGKSYYCTAAFCDDVTLFLMYALQCLWTTIVQEVQMMSAPIQVQWINFLLSDQIFPTWMTTIQGGFLLHLTVRVHIIKSWSCNKFSHWLTSSY